VAAGTGKSSKEAPPAAEADNVVLWMPNDVAVWAYRYR
jgi:hypothetical protein